LSRGHWNPTCLNPSWLWGTQPNHLLYPIQRHRQICVNPLHQDDSNQCRVAMPKGDEFCPKRGTPFHITKKNLDLLAKTFHIQCFCKSTECSKKACIYWQAPLHLWSFSRRHRMPFPVPNTLWRKLAPFLAH
jgi:hypothetical protein